MGMIKKLPFIMDYLILAIIKQIVCREILTPEYVEFDVLSLTKTDNLEEIERILPSLFKQSSFAPKVFFLLNINIIIIIIN